MSNFDDLNLGSKASLQSAAPAAPAQPALELGPAMPPPPGFGPGETSAAGMKMQDSTMGQIANFFIGANLAPGEISGEEKLALAKRKQLTDEATVRLNYANYLDTHKAAEKALQVINRRAITDGYEFLQNADARLAMIEDPDERKKAAASFSKMAGHFHQEFAELPLMMAEDPARMLGLKSALNDDDLGTILRPVVMGRKYVDVAKDETVHNVVRVHGKDTLNKIFTRLHPDDQKAISEGNVGQEQFIPMFMRAMDDPSLAKGKPVDRAFAKHALVNTDYGEEFMRYHGIKTFKHAAKMQDKEKPEGSETMSSIQAQQFRKAEAIANSPTASADEKEAAQKQMGLLLHTESKDQGANPNNMVNQRLQILSGGVVPDVASIAKIKDPKKKAQALAWAEQARSEQDRASSQAQMQARMETPADSADYIDAEHLRKTGMVRPVREAVTEGELRTNKTKYVKATEAQRKEIRTLNATVESADQIFDAAENAFKGDNSGMSQTAAESVVLAESNVVTDQAKRLAKIAYPELAEFLSRREATLGQFARSISGEVGVLTDQDTGRVRNLFPTAGDTAAIRASKRKALKALVNLNKKFTSEALAGGMSGDEIAELKKTDAYRSAAQGILGSVEGVTADKKTEAPRGESLLERMRKEKS